MKMNLSVIVVFRDNLSLIVFHDNLFLLSFCDNPSILSSVFHDNPSGVFHDNPSVLSGVFHDNPSVLSGVFRDDPSGVFCDNSSISSSDFHEIRLLFSMTIFYELFCRQSLVVLCGNPLSYSELFCVLLFVVNSSEDSLLLSCVAVRCLTLSSSLFFYYASFATWVSFFRR